METRKNPPQLPMPDRVMEAESLHHFPASSRDKSHPSTAFDYMEAAPVPHFSSVSSLPQCASFPLAPPSSYAADSSVACLRLDGSYSSALVPHFSVVFSDAACFIPLALPSSDAADSAEEDYCEVAENRLRYSPFTEKNICQPDRVGISWALLLQETVWGSQYLEW
ncbi:hypothetical protein OROHE_000847 [Orobanche hederae]